MIFYAELCAKFSISGIIELRPIVGNDDPGDIESVDDGLPSEVLDASLSNLCQGLGLHPLSKVIDSYHQESHLLLSPRELPNYVDPLLYEGPQACYRCQLFCQFLRDIKKSLALVSFSGKEGGIFLHGGPIVSNPDCFVGQRSTS